MAIDCSIFCLLTFGTHILACFLLMQPRPSGSKSRPAARKRLNADDSPFIGPSAGAKRGADKPDGGMERAKRKRAEAHATGTLGKRTERLGDGEVTALSVCCLNLSSTFDLAL